MIGRSHAMLGALGFLAIIPASRVEIPDEILYVGTAIAGVSFATLIAVPSGVQAQRSKETYFIDLLYKFVYRTISIPMMLLIGFVCVQWITKFAPWLIPTHPASILLWTAVASGWALVPDLDEKGSTIAREFGALSIRFSKLTRRIAGGHRMATHSWIMVFIGLILSIVAHLFLKPLAAVIVAISFVFAVRVILPEKAREQSIPIMLTAALAALLIFMGDLNTAPMIIAMPLGILLHDLGDWFTRAGITFWYPYKKKYGAGMMHTGSFSELRFAQPLMILAISGLIAYLVVIPIFTDPSVIDPQGVMTHYEGLQSLTKDGFDEMVNRALSLQH